MTLAEYQSLRPIIEFNAGTGGSAGVEYLLDVATDGIRQPLFAELWEVRDALLARTVVVAVAVP